MRIGFGQAVEQHGETVLRVCRSTLGPGPDADDAWQETFLSAMRAWPELDEEANVEAWLVTIARRRSLDQVRAAARRALPVADVPESQGGDEASFEERLVLWQWLDELPPKQRRAVARHHLAGSSHAEVAARLGGTPAAARRAASDGNAALRRRHAASRASPEGEN